MRSLAPLAAATLITITALAANAGVVEDRKANFNANNASMRVISAAIGAGDFETIASEAEKIAAWAMVMPDYFPEEAVRGTSAKPLSGPISSASRMRLRRITTPPRTRSPPPPNRMPRRQARHCRRLAAPARDATRNSKAGKSQYQAGRSSGSAWAASCNSQISASPSHSLDRLISPSGPSILPGGSLARPVTMAWVRLVFAPNL